jgi:hypothetical protein
LALQRRLDPELAGYKYAMASLTTTRELHETLDFVVESASGTLGRVEEIWLGPGGGPQAVAVRLKDGSRALLLEEDVLVVDRERHWVVARPGADLLELDLPRLASRDGDGHLAASWSTTGSVVHPHESAPAPTGRPSRPTTDRPLWRVVAILYASVGLVVVLVVTLVFVVSRLIEGSAY